MAISEDASTPASVTVTGVSAVSATTASFSPPASSLLVAIVAVGYGGGGGSPSISLSDTGGHTWTTGPTVFDNEYDYSGIFFTYLSTAPGSITVTAKNSDSTSTQGMLLSVRVVDGAASSQTGAASHTATGTSSSLTSSITTTTTGSWVYVAGEFADNASFTVNGNTTAIWNLNDGSDNQAGVTGRATNATVTPGAITLGWTTSSAAEFFSWAALEILPSSGSPSGSVTQGFVFGSSVSGFQGNSSVTTGFTFGSSVIGQPVGAGATIAQSVSAGVINDYGLDSVPFSMQNPAVASSGLMGSALVAYVTWNVAFYTYQSSGRSPAVTVTDSAGNLWRQIAISAEASGSRCAIWIALNARQVTWVSVALTGWAYSTSYTIAEVSGLPQSMQMVSIDFTENTFSSSAVTSLTVPPGTATTTDVMFACLGTGGATTSLSVPSGWGLVAAEGGANQYDSVCYSFLGSSTGGTVNFTPSWTTATPASGCAVALKQTAAAPTQSNPNFPRVVVEAAFGADPGDWTQSTDYTYSVEGITWTDLTSRVLTKEDEASITIGRGRQYELTAEETGEIHVRLDNHDGAFTYTNTTSPYYPFCIPGVPIRVTAWWTQTSGNPIQYPVAFGYTERWPQEWPDMPQWGFATLIATDAYGPLANTTMPSAVEGDIRKDYPYAYFPTDEQYSFTQTSLESAGVKVPIDANGFIAVNKAFGNNRYAAYRDGGDGNPVTTGQALNLLGDDDTALGVTTYPGQVSAVGGPGMFYSDPNIPTNSSGTQAFSIEFWFLTGWSADTYKCTLMSAFGRPSTYYDNTNTIPVGSVITIGVNTGSTSGLYVNGTAVATATTANAFSSTNPYPQHFVITCSPVNGTTCYLNGELCSGQPANLVSIPQIRAICLGPARYAYDCNNKVDYQGYNYVAGHLGIYQQELTPTMISNHFNSGFTGMIGDSAPRRFSKVLTWGLLGLKRGGAMWIGTHGISENTTMSEAYSYEGSTGGDVIGQLIQSEFGRCFTQGNGCLIYVPRWLRYNQTPVATFGDNGTTQIPFMQSTSFTVDDSFIFNQINAVQNRGPNTDILVQQTNFASQLLYFNRSGLNLQSYVMSPFDVYGVVGWTSVKYNNPVQRVSEIEVNPASAQGKLSSSFSTILGLELDKLVTVTRTPVGGANFSVTGPIQKIEHEIGASYWKTKYQVTPAFPETNTLTADTTGYNTPGSNYLAW